MHPTPIIRGRPDDRNIAFARARGFGTLCVNCDAGPLVSHVPFLIAPDATSVDLHLVRSNPIARLEGSVPAIIAVTGSDGYVSPDWYAEYDQVPTWNYVAVHLRGTLEQLPHETMHDMLDRQSAAYESKLAPKTPWTTDKMSGDALAKMMRMILPFRLTVESLDGTWKLNQNKSETARLGAAEQIAAGGMGSELNTLAALMRDPPPKE